MDTIQIRDLALRAVVGIYPEERREKQDVILNITLYADLSKAGTSDDIRDTVDYKTLKKQIIHHVESSSHQLIEAMAEKVAAICLGDSRVLRAAVTVDKPAALRFARSVAVTIDRAR